MEKSKILIVDDDPDLRQALKLRLRANQYDTVHAVDGYSAIALAYKEHSSSNYSRSRLARRRRVCGARPLAERR